MKIKMVVELDKYERQQILNLGILKEVTPLKVETEVKVVEEREVKDEKDNFKSGPAIPQHINYLR